MVEESKSGDSGQTLREAAEWLAQHRTGRIDEAAFARWRNASPAHALAFCRVLALWRTGAADSEAAAVVAEPRTMLPLSSRRDLLRAGGIAGLAAILTGGIFVAPAYAWRSATTNVGESRRLILSDGSEVELNTDSKLSWRLSATERVFWLEKGEVCMNLRGGPAAVIRGCPAPIVITSGLFNLRLNNTSAKLLVIKGRAKIGGVGQQQATITGQSAMNTALITPEETHMRGTGEEQVDAAVSWRTHAIVFQDVPLSHAVGEYNRYLTNKIVIADADVADTPVGGRFETGDPTAFLNAISLGLGIHVVKSADHYTLQKANVTRM